MKSLIFATILLVGPLLCGCSASRRSAATAETSGTLSVDALETITRTILDSCRLDITLTIDSPTIHFPDADFRARDITVEGTLNRRREVSETTRDTIAAVATQSTARSETADTAVDAARPDILPLLVILGLLVILFWRLSRSSRP